jgi:hypothetical protein
VLPGGYKTFSYEKVSSVTFLDDIISETLRLKPPAVTFPARETPPQGIRIGDVYIPGNVNVVCNPMLMQNNPRFWQEPEKFIPDRWGERRAEMGTDGSPFFPFSLGTYHSHSPLIAGYLIKGLLQGFMHALVSIWPSLVCVSLLPLLCSISILRLRLVRRVRCSTRSVLILLLSSFHRSS